MTYDEYVKSLIGLDEDTTYTVWIGFKTGTFWIRAGNVTEDVIYYAQEKLLDVLGK